MATESTKVKQEVYDDSGIYDIDDGRPDPPVDPQEDYVDDPGEVTVGASPEFDEGGGPEATWTQEDFDAAVKRRLKRQERSIARELGVDLAEAKEWIAAGKSIGDASGLTPAQIRMKMEETRMQQAQAAGQHYAPPADDELKTEVRELKQMITSDYEEKAFKAQEAEAKKEFGDLYSKHREAIEDKAEESGLSLVDAAAIVLRPKLREIAEGKVQARQQVQRSRKIEGSDEGAGSAGVDVNTALSDKQKRVAQRMGVPFEKYYQRLKEMGGI